MKQEIQNLIIKSLDEWTQALDLFSRSTSLVTSLYLPNGNRVCGPFTHTPFGKLLVSSGKFSNGQLCHYTEEREVLKISSQESVVSFDFLKALRVDGVPIMIGTELVGIVFVGWVFDHFPDPIECDRIAKELDVPQNQVWQLARLQNPISSEKFQVYEEMLRLVTTTLMKQLLAFHRLQEAARVKDELLAIVSHELKTPLTSILLRIQMLKSHRVNPQRMDEFLSSMEKNARVEAKLIDDLLDAARMVTGKYHFDPVLMDLREVLTDVADMMSDSAREKKIELSIKGLELKAPFFGDPVRLQQAFLNLMTNSVKFTPEHGKIELNLNEGPATYVIRVRDSGKGIDKSFIPQIFDTFSQEPSSDTTIHSGLGLGLALVKNIVDIHNGKIQILTPGNSIGTEFEITLPKNEFFKD